jgi:hypothetical protein
VSVGRVDRAVHALAVVAERHRRLDDELVAAFGQLEGQPAAVEPATSSGAPSSVTECRVTGLTSRNVLPRPDSNRITVRLGNVVSDSARSRVTSYDMTRSRSNR